jgi:hypothetical protein
MLFDLTIAQLSTFMIASVLITLAPGPDNIAVLGLGMTRGRRAGIGFGPWVLYPHTLGQRGHFRSDRGIGHRFYGSQTAGGRVLVLAGLAGAEKFGCPVSIRHRSGRGSDAVVDLRAPGFRRQRHQSKGGAFLPGVPAAIRVVGQRTCCRAVDGSRPTVCRANDPDLWFAGVFCRHRRSVVAAAGRIWAAP